MPNYLVNHLLLGPGPAAAKDSPKDGSKGTDAERVVFKPDTIVTEQQLTDAGFDIERLATPKPGGFSAAIIAQRGPARGK